MKIKVVFPVVALVAVLAVSSVALADDFADGGYHGYYFKDIPLMHAAAHGGIKEVRAQLAAGADVNAANENGGTALIAAASENHGEIVKILLAAGADVNAADEDGTALVVVAEKGYGEVVKILLAAGADVNAADEVDATALIFAVLRNHDEVVKILLVAGADVNAVFADWTVLDLAEGKSTEPIIRNYSPGQYAHLLADIEAYSDEQKREFAGVREDAERKRAEKESEKTATAEQPAETTAEQEPTEAAAESADSGLVKPGDCKALFGDAEVDEWMRDVVTDALTEKGIGCYSLSE